MAKDSFWDDLSKIYYTMANDQGGAIAPGGSLGYNPQQVSVPTTESPWYMQAAKGFLGELVPAAGAAATGLVIDRMFPGTPGKGVAMDLRQPEMQRGAGMAEERLRNLQLNPNSFGLPGDPNDINTPAGRRLYQLRKNRRAAEAAGGRLETGGAALRETEDVNTAIANEYNQALNSGFSNLAAMAPQQQFAQIPGKENPFAKILTAAVAPGVGKGLKAGTEAAMKAWAV